MTKIKILMALSAVALTTPAMAATLIVSTDQAKFDATHSVTTNDFSFTAGASAVLTPSYTLNGVTFSSTALYGQPTGINSLTPAHLDAKGTPLFVTFDGSVLGLSLAAYDGAQTISYLVNGIAGTLALPANRATRFIGFDTGSPSTPINAAFTFTSGTDLDVVGFQTPAAAVPEPATWAMMILGMGAIGFAMRSAKRRSDIKFDAKIKRISEGAFA